MSDNVTAWHFDPRRAVLLVHDMQEHFVGVFDRRGPQGPDQLDAAIEHMTALVAAARRAGVPVVYTAQPPAQDPADRALLTDFWGPGLADASAAGIVAPLTPRESDVVLTKWRYSAFYRSDLRQRMELTARDQLVVTGVYAHIGCLTTALVAFMEGIRVFFAADAMADFSAEDHIMATRYVARRCGQVVTTREVLRSLDEHVLRGACSDTPAVPADALRG
nr:isochorismatase family protein [Kineosphaera limosa]